MKICNKCGAQLIDEAVFCTNCGAETNNTNNATSRVSDNRQQSINPAYIQPENNFTNVATVNKPTYKISKKGIIAIVVAIAIVLSIFTFIFNGAFIKNNETNTIMVYMVGSDLESQNGAASKDITEMAKSGIDFNKNNVLVYAGGSSYWNLDISTDYNSLIQIKKDSYDIVATTDYPLNMGDPGTLSNFLQYCYDSYNTDNYSLVLWNHGGGPLGGYGVDELYDGDRLMISELDEALASSPFVGDNKLDWIGFDACLMASIEIAEVMSNYSDYMIASQETEPGSGWDYSFLSAYNKTSDSVKIAENIIDSYFSSIENMVSSVFNPEITLSCLDLSKLDNTISAMDAFFGELDVYLDLGGFTTLARNRENTKAYGLSASSSKGDSYDLVDLGNLTENIVDDYQPEAEQLKSAIDEMVIYEKNNVSGSTGVSIYYPYDNVLYYDYLGSDLCKYYESSTGYSNYIDQFADMWLNGNENGDVNKTINPLSNSDSDSIAIQLTPEQLQNYSSAYYTVLEKDQLEGQDVYTPILSNCKVAPDDNGVIKVSSVQDLFLVNDSICHVRQTENLDEKANYVTENSRLYNGNFRVDTLISMFEDISISFTNEGYDDISIQNILLDEDNNIVSGKTTIDISNWENFGYYYKEYLPKYNDENKLLPYTEWDDNGWSCMSTVAIYDDTINFSTIPSNEYSQELVCQIVVEDCQGNYYASDLFALKQNVSTQSTVKSENGELVFDVYSDHSELVGYTGTDELIEIPSNVEGKTVTKISGRAFDDRSGEYAVNLGNQSITEVILPNTITEISDFAFYTVTNLEKINFPEGLEKIGDCAFFETALTSVEFPNTLKSIGREAFGYTQIQSVIIPASVDKILDNPFVSCDNLTEFFVEKKNKNYTVVDGFLCTRDKKTIISGLNVENVVIPKKIETIGKYAFADYDAVKSVKFSNKVTNIGDYAFFNTSLSEVTLPEKLNIIGFCAFRNTMMDGLLDDEVIPGFTEISIPSTVTYIGEAAFSGQPISQFNVSDKNNAFSASGQFLMNKNGEQLIACGGGIGGVVTVPEGVKEIKSNAFTGCNKIGRNDDSMDIIEIIVPDSVVAIKDDLCIINLEKLTIGKNVMIWAYYDNIDLSDENNFYPEVNISNENKNFSINEGKIVKNENDKLTTFRLN